MKDYANAIAFLGEWGRFQQVVFFLLCASIVPNGFGAFMLVFVNDIPGHHCAVPDVNLTEDWLQTIIPVKVRLPELLLKESLHFLLSSALTSELSL